MTIQTDNDSNCHTVEECIEANVTAAASGEPPSTVKSPKELSDGNSSAPTEIFDISPTTDKPLSMSKKEFPVTTPPLLEVPQPQNGLSNKVSINAGKTNLIT